MKSYFALFLLIGLLTACATTDNVVDRLQSKVSQNNLSYIDKKDKRYVLIKQNQTVLANDYIRHWFSPWTGKAFSAID